MRIDVKMDIDDLVVDLLARRIAERLPPLAASNWLTVAGAAAHLATTEGAIRSLVKRRGIPFHKVGGRLLFERACLDEWVRAGGAG